MSTKYFFLLFFLTAVLLFPRQETSNTQESQNAQETPQVKETPIVPGAQLAQDTQTEEGKKVKKPRKYEIDVAYIYQEESKVISETDLQCTHFIKNDQSEDIIITGSEFMNWQRIDYSDTDRMFIGKGSQDGIKEEDVFMVLGKGEKITNPLTNKSLGTFYLKKSLAKIYCLYEDKAIIVLLDGCQPVQIGDILIPYKPIEPLFKKKLDYQLCRLPQGTTEGHVVYSNAYTGFTRQLSSAGQYVTVDIGNALVERGDWLIFYILINKDLPPFIAGFGIVIDTQSTCSTVKVMDTTYPIEIGTPLVMMPTPRGDATPLDTTTSTEGLKDKLPTMDGLKNEDGTPAGNLLSFDVIFDINSKTIIDFYKPELDKIPPFVADKSEYIIILRGYACSIGSMEYNLRLSQERVNAIKKFLMETYNIKEEFIESYFYGEKESTFDNSIEEQRRLNRRVNIEVRAR